MSRTPIEMEHAAARRACIQRDAVRGQRGDRGIEPARVHRPPHAGGLITDVHATGGGHVEGVGHRGDSARRAAGNRGAELLPAIAVVAGSQDHGVVATASGAYRDTHGAVDTDEGGHALSNHGHPRAPRPSAGES